MEREDNSDPIPIDIILEILSRSYTKSIVRFGLASKSCASILRVRRPDFTKLFSTRSTTRPRLLLAIGNSDKWRLYSAPQPQNPDEKHSLVVAADFHMQFHGDMTAENICGPLLCFSNMKISKEDIDSVPLICNPSTGQDSRLPQLRRKSDTRSLLGYDPIGKQYKVLALSASLYEDNYILTLGTGKSSWRKIECNVNHCPTSNGICINGVLYYISIAGMSQGAEIACFDVRYEKLRFLNADSTTRNISLLSLRKLINYKGKFGVISWSYDRQNYWKPSPECVVRLYLWTLEDPQKQEWLKRDYTLTVDIGVKGHVFVFGVTATGEIVLSMNYSSKSQFFVIYFNPEKNTLKKVEIQGCKAVNRRSRVYGFLDYAEDFNFI